MVGCVNLGQQSVQGSGQTGFYETMVGSVLLRSAEVPVFWLMQEFFPFRGAVGSIDVDAFIYLTVWYKTMF